MDCSPRYLRKKAIFNVVIHPLSMLLSESVWRLIFPLFVNFRKRSLGMFLYGLI